MFKKIDLPYSYEALEPYIDAKTVEIHYTKHHEAYTSKLNAALEGKNDLLSKSLPELLKSASKLEEPLKTAVLNNGGQVFNHDLYWQTFSTNGGGMPEGKLLEAINTTFGSFEAFKSEFSDAAATQFGSGWAWLSKDENGKLVISKTSNAENPLLHGLTPLMTIDVWEHAYYLNYQNKRPDYIEAFWSIVDWKGVGERFEA